MVFLKPSFTPLLPSYIQNMALILKDKSDLLEISINDTYNEIEGYIITAKQQVYKDVNSAMVEAYWNIGKKIYEICGENDRAEYGKQVLKDISQKLTTEFGKGFSIQNLRRMRQFYINFQKRSTLSSELSWSHFQILMRIENEDVRTFYTNECAKSSWSVR